jgi:hypothetical protein
MYTFLRFFHKWSWRWCQCFHRKRHLVVGQEYIYGQDRSRICCERCERIWDQTSFDCMTGWLIEEVMPSSGFYWSLD